MFGEFSSRKIVPAVRFLDAPQVFCPERAGERAFFRGRTLRFPKVFFGNRGRQLMAGT